MSNSSGDKLDPNEDNVIENRWPTIEIPSVTVSRFIIERLRYYGEKKFLTENDSNISFTFNEVADDSLKMAQILINSGLKKGDHFGVCGLNNYEFVTTLFGGLIANGVAVPINASKSVDDISRIIRDKRIKLLTLATRQQKLKSSDSLKKFGKAVKSIVSFSDESDTSRHNYGDAGDYARMRKYISGQEAKNESLVGIVDTFDSKTKGCLIVDTSDTTESGQKSCLITDHNLIAQLTISALPLIGFNWTERDVVANTSSFSHMNGLIQLFAALTSGSRFILFPHCYSQLGVKSLSQASRRFRITAAMLSPLAIVEMVKETDTSTVAMVSSLKKVICTGSSMPKNIAAKFVSKYGIDDFRQAYGTTEITGFVTMEPTGSEQFECCGMPLPLARIKIVDTDTGASLDSEQIGEVCVQSPQLVSGYLRADASADGWDVDVDAVAIDGWFHTGDVGYYDHNAKLQIVDQIDDFLQYRSLQISPTALEGILLSHDSVREVAIVGTPDANGDQKPTAFVVLQPNAIVEDNTENKLTNYINNHLSKQNLSLSGGLYIIDEIPKSVSGKIMRKSLRKLVMQTLKEVSDDGVEDKTAYDC